MWIWFVGRGGTGGCCFEERVEDVGVAWEEGVLRREGAASDTRLPLIEPDGICSGGSTGEMEMAVTEAEWAWYRRRD